ncbi:metal-binding heat shock protein [Chelonobacter oris]|uniref:Endoribonuclease YbeY n=1 Tax=Chelonobacter oris TaxID=505317 RepID=A0A0A3AKT0_9PAST|nr:rRNA maturation RNase YbeY [Chelonobacter oris]KGQ69946.1 metal-binding heat shock protein [Chelonobacter oris]
MKKIVIDLQIAVKQPQNLPSAAQIAHWAQSAVRPTIDDLEMTVRIVDEEESQTLNRTYRGKDYPTNVLSFPFESPAEVELPLLGDLVICRQVVEREAAEQQKPVLAHWAHMVVHGSLHLLGYDHLDDEEAEEMESLERAIMAELGFDDPYLSEQEAFE